MFWNYLTFLFERKFKYNFSNLKEDIKMSHKYKWDLHIWWFSLTSVMYLLLFINSTLSSENWRPYPKILCYIYYYMTKWQVLHLLLFYGYLFLAFIKNKSTWIPIKNNGNVLLNPLFKLILERISVITINITNNNESNIQKNIKNFLQCNHMFKVLYQEWNIQV